MRIELDKKDGHPIKNTEIFIDLTNTQTLPDGSVIDASGNLWNAQWGASRISKYDLHGKYKDHLSVQASQTSCPAFGGPNFSTMFVTSAGIGVDEKFSGCTFYCDTEFIGQKENCIQLI